MWSLPDRINGKPNSSQNGAKKKTSRKKNRLNLQQKFREVGRKNFKAAKIATRPAKISCFGEKFLAQDIKTLTGEGTKAEKAKKQIGKRWLRAKEEGETDTKWIIVERVFFKKHLREVCHNGISPPTPVSRSVAQTGSAPRSGRGGRRFKSSHSDHFSLKICFLSGKSPNFQSSKHRKSNAVFRRILLCFARDFIVYHCLKSLGS